ncbi:DEAD/DEAH box helicase, partial [Senegalimassilia faecalis]
QYIMPIANRKKQELLEAVLNEKGHERVIVFARTKNRTEECAEALEADGFHAESIHSDKTQGRRRRALENFRRGKTDILVATDVLARGIDVPDVNYVINFDLPDMAEDYVHRIGRTGRAGEEGFAISFVTRETVKTLREIEKLIGKDIPFTTIESYETDPSILEKPKRGERKGGTRRGGGKPAGARRQGEKRAERAEREGRRPNTDERRDARKPRYERDDRDFRGGRPGRDDRPGRGSRNDRGGRYDRDNRGGNGRGKGGNRDFRGGRDNNREWLSDEEYRARRNAKNAQSRLHKKERKAQAGSYKQNKPANKKKRGGEGGYDYSRFTK